MEKLDKQYDYRRSLIMNVLVFSVCTFGVLLMELVLAAPPMKEFAWHAAILILCESGVCVFYSNLCEDACTDEGGELDTCGVCREGRHGGIKKLEIQIDWIVGRKEERT